MCNCNRRIKTDTERRVTNSANRVNNTNTTQNNPDNQTVIIRRRTK